MNSGILRFYANSRKKSSASHGHLIDLESSQKVDFNDPHTVDLLLSTSLLRESNGISRRLAASAITPSFNLASTDNIELIPIISQYRYSEPELYEAAFQNIITRLRLQFRLSSSIIPCIRKMLFPSRTTH